MFPHISAIGAGAAGLLQTAAAASVRRLAIDMDISHADRDQVMAFLAQNQSLGYLPKSGQITGILKQMKETFHCAAPLRNSAELLHRKSSTVARTYREMNCTNIQISSRCVQHPYGPKMSSFIQPRTCFDK